eukprot:UN26979
MQDPGMNFNEKQYKKKAIDLHNFLNENQYSCLFWLYYKTRIYLVNLNDTVHGRAILLEVYDTHDKCIKESVDKELLDFMHVSELNGTKNVCISNMITLELSEKHEYGLVKIKNQLCIFMGSFLDKHQMLVFGKDKTKEVQIQF